MTPTQAVGPSHRGWAAEAEPAAPDSHSANPLTLPSRNALRESIPLRVLSGGDPRLLNTYAVIVPAGRHRAAARARQFVAWLTDGNGREVIERFRVGPNKVPAFFPWPAGAPRDRPDALPK